MDAFSRDAAGGRNIAAEGAAADCQSPIATGRAKVGYRCTVGTGDVESTPGKADRTRIVAAERAILQLCAAVSVVETSAGSDGRRTVAAGGLHSILGERAVFQ